MSIIKASKDFVMREIMGEFMLIPTGPAAVKINGMVSLNEIGHFIFQALQKEQTEQSLVEKITAEYRTDAETALTDLREFLDQQRSIGALVED